MSRRSGSQDLTRKVIPVTRVDPPGRAFRTADGVQRLHPRPPCGARHARCRAPPQRVIMARLLASEAPRGTCHVSHGRCRPARPSARSNRGARRMTRSRPADRRNPRQPRAAGGAEEAVTLQRQWRVPRHAPAVAGRLPLAADLSVSRPPSSAAILSMTSDLFSLPIPGCLMSVPQSSFRSGLRSAPRFHTTGLVA